MAIGANRLNRLAIDSKNVGLNFYGPWICLRNDKAFYKPTDSALSNTYGGYEAITHLKPNRFAFEPQGKKLYLTRYFEHFAITAGDAYKHNYWQHAVYKMDYEEDKEPELFLGAAESGSDNSHFYMPADVACDSKGRVYVADLGNHRVQIFTPEGKMIKTIPVESPAQVSIAPTGEIYVFTWGMLTDLTKPRIKVEKPFVLRKFKSAEDPELLATYDLPMAETNGQIGQCAEIDFWSETPTLWINPGLAIGSNTRPVGILVLLIKDKTLEPIQNFEKEVKESVIETMAPGSNRQRLYWDPKKEKLYVGEGSTFFSRGQSY
jgi:DNA-binding beta-propeller fold protein YncE